LEDLKKTLAGEAPASPVVLPIAIEEYMTNKCGVPYRAFSTDVDKAFSVWDYAIHKYGIDAALIFIDDFFEYETFGLELVSPENSPRACVKYIAPSAEWLSRARIPTFEEGRFPVRAGLVNKLRKRWGDDLLVCASVAAPFTGATLLYGIADTMLLFYDDERLLEDTMAFTSALSIACSKRLIEAGANMIWYGDCAASSKFIDAAKFDRFLFEPTRSAIEQIKALGATVVYHANENKAAHIERMARLKADIVSCGEHTSMPELYDAAGGECCLMGNLDPIQGIMNGTVESIRALVARQRDMMAGRSKYIVNTGEGITTKTTEENFRAFLDACRETGVF